MGLFWKVVGTCGATFVAIAIAMKVQYQLTSEFKRKQLAELRRELQREIDEEGVVERLREERERSARQRDASVGKQRDEAS